jgi:hypothetical protein
MCIIIMIKVMNDVCLWQYTKVGDIYVLLSYLQISFFKRQSQADEGRVQGPPQIQRGVAAHPFERC